MPTVFMYKLYESNEESLGQKMNIYVQEKHFNTISKHFYVPLSTVDKIIKQL